jgi:ABC-type branched-subunit amino acid transport system substrate-binding protein
VVHEYQRFSAKPGTYSYYGLEGYLMARTMVEGLSRMGSKDPSRERLVNALEGMRDVDLGGFRVNYSPLSHQGSSFVELTVLGPGGKILK